MKQYVRLSIITLSLCISLLSALDLPQFYRAALFQGDTHESFKDGATHVGFRYAEGSTNEAYNVHENKTHLFNGHGPFDLRMLAINMENIKNYPKTEKYLEEGGTDNANITKFTYGNMAFKGHFKTTEYDLSFQQNITSGLYFYAYLPIRKLVLEQIDHTSAVTACSDCDEHEKLATFVTDNLDNILAEHCITPLKTKFDKTAVGDPIIALGWHGEKDFDSNELITKARGSIQAGLLLPLGKKRDENAIFSLPFGYNGHWGFNLRLHGQANVFKHIGLGVNAGITVLLKETRDLRMTTSDVQNGWIKLSKGHATVDQGSVWDAGVYAKIDQPFGGFSALVSYAFTQQERTWLHVKDDCFLKTVLADKKIPHKEYVVNSDKTLQKWYQHVIHAVAQYDFKAHTDSTFAPYLEFSYSCPLTGRYIFDTDMLAGTAELCVRWSF